MSMAAAGVVFHTPVPPIDPTIPVMLEVMRLSPQAILPQRCSEHAAGYDLAAPCEYSVPPRGRETIMLDLGMAIPAGYYGRIAPRSSLASKHHIDVGGGVIDPDYRGNVGVILFNHGDTAFVVAAGQRVAQLIIERIATPSICEVTTLPATVRGSGGFGSTGRFAPPAATLRPFVGEASPDERVAEDISEAASRVSGIARSIEEDRMRQCVGDTSSAIRYREICQQLRSVAMRLETSAARMRVSPRPPSPSALM